MVSPSTRMKIDKLPDYGRIEVASTERLIRENGIREKPLQLTSEPVADRNSESHFPARQDLIGQQSSKRTLENVLRRSASKLVSRRQAGSEFHGVVIQKRRACFKRNRHACDVYFHKQVVRKIV